MIVMDVQKAQAESPPVAPKAAVIAEPATDRALWPTFMRRTLADESLTRTPRKADA